MNNLLKMLLISEVLADDDPILIKREKERQKKWGWWAKEGHWNHTTFRNAMSHLFRGGKIRFGRW